MKNLEHSKSNFIGIMLILISVIYKFSPIFWAHELSKYGSNYQPSNLGFVTFISLGIGLLFLYPEPFTTIIKKVADKYFK